ncbi:MAG: hypothetical protein LUJ09_04175 [Firmicutes bacterium]|nr:hypothetical protein [Bacillota bacterium]
MTRKNQPCSGCAYYYGNSESDVCCNYLLKTGKRRPCPPGKDCTVRKVSRNKKSKMEENKK